MNRFLLIFLLFTVDVFGGEAQRIEVHQGILRVEPFRFCRDSCDVFYIDPEPGSSFVNVRGDLESHIDKRVRITGVQSACGGCISLYPTQDIILLPMTDVEEEAEQLPTRPVLLGNYPNPFNPGTVIRYALPSAAVVNISIVNVYGEEISRPLNDERQERGIHEIDWLATDFPSGVYYARISVKSISIENLTSTNLIQPMLLLK